MIHPVTSLLTPELDPAAVAPQSPQSTPAPSSAFALLLANGTTGNQERPLSSHTAAAVSEPLDLPTGELAESSSSVGVVPSATLGQRNDQMALDPESGRLLPGSELNRLTLAGKLLPQEASATATDLADQSPTQLPVDAAVATPSAMTILSEAEITDDGSLSAPIPVAANTIMPVNEPDLATPIGTAIRPAGVERLPAEPEGVAANRSSKPAPLTTESAEAAGVPNQSAVVGQRVPEGATARAAADASVPRQSDPRLTRMQPRAELPEISPTRADRMTLQSAPEKVTSPDPLSTAIRTTDSRATIAYRAAPETGDQQWLRTSDPRYQSQGGNEVQGQRQAMVSNLPETVAISRQPGESPANSMVAGGNVQTLAAANPTAVEQGSSQSLVQQFSTPISTSPSTESEPLGLRALDKAASAAPPAVTTLQLTLGNRQELGQQLGTLLGSVRSLTGSELSIALAPQELGRLEIKMTTGPDQSLNVSITTQHAGTRDLVEAQLNRLKTALDGEGFERVQVDLRDERGGRFGARQDSDPHGSGARWGEPNRDGNAARPPAENARAADLPSGSQPALTVGVSALSQHTRGATGGLLPGIDAYA